MPAETQTLPPVEALQSPAPSLAENLAFAAQQTARLEAELETIAGTNDYPEWWAQEAGAFSAARSQLKAPGADPAHVSEYFQIYKKQHEIREIVSGRDVGMYPFAMVCLDLGSEVVASGLVAESVDGPIHAAVVDSLMRATVNKYEYIAPEMDLLRQAYGKASATELLQVVGDENSDTLKPLLRSERAINVMRTADQERTAGESWSVTQMKAHKWTAQALSIAAGISESEAAEYTFAVSRTGKDERISEMLDRFDHFGVERLRALADLTGIHAFEAYSVEQLERMEELVQDPQAAAEHLSKHDVTVVMTNRVGDYSGILSSVAESFEDGNDRTLFLEINNMGDIYRHMLKLQKLNIKPSTLVLAAHSAPGQFMVSDIREPAMKRRDIATVAGRALVQLVNSNSALESGDFGYSMHDMKGMARLVEDLMQPSRAIDDATEDIGRRKVLFQACYAASEADSKDIDSDGEKFSKGMDSVISRIGSDLVANGTKSNIDIYGAPAGIQLHKSKRGVRYSGKAASLGGERQRQHAVRIRVDNGGLTRQEVDEVIMHKAA